MTGSTLALQMALVTRLNSHAPLVVLLGGEKVFDDVPQGTIEPYVTASDIETRDWSSQTSRGEEHDATLHIWSRGRGRKQALEIAAEIEAALDAGPLTLAGHTLVNLRIAGRAVRREARNDLYHGSVRLRAITEVSS